MDRRPENALCKELGGKCFKKCGFTGGSDVAGVCEPILVFSVVVYRVQIQVHLGKTEIIFAIIKNHQNTYRFTLFRNA